MYAATQGRPLATTITGSLPRPGWFTEDLGGRPFLDVFAGVAAFREQYADAVAALIADQTRAGLDVLSDGEMRFDRDVGGRSWFGYLFDRLDGLEPAPRGGAASAGRPGFERRARTSGDILGEFTETLLPARIVGPVGAGSLQYDAIWKVAQRLTPKPVKLGSCSAQLLDRQIPNRFYPSRRESVLALSRALNEEYHRLADAGCHLIQIEEPVLHSTALHGSPGLEWDLSLDEYVEAFNVEVAGLRQKTEVWCHTCWGNPFAQRLTLQPSYRPVLPWLDRLEVDVITIEATENGGAEIGEVAAALSRDKKLCIGVLSHRRLQVETPEEVASLIRTALRAIAPERLVLSSDCGFGRQGMSRTHAFYKMVALVRGANLVRHELGLPEVEVPAADPCYALR